MQQALTDLTNAINADISVESQAVTLIQNLTANVATLTTELANAVAAANTAAIESLVSQLSTSTQALNAVVNPSANTANT